MTDPTITSCIESISVVDTLDVLPATWTFPLTAHAPRKSSIAHYNKNGCSNGKNREGFTLGR